MPTSVSSKGYEGGKNPARTKVRPKKTVVTVSSTGKVSATGPESAAATKDAEASVKRVKKAVKATKTEAHTKAVAKRLAVPKPPRAKTANELAKEFPGLTKVEEAKSVKQSEGGLDAKDVAKFAADEAKSIWKAEEEHQHQEIAGGVAKYKGPSANQISAGLTEAGALSPLLKGAGATEAAVNAASKASDANTVKNAVAAAAKKASDETANLATRVKTKPGRVVQSVKEAPTKVKELPKDIRKAVETPEARRATAKAGGKTALRHPIKTGVPAAAIVPPGIIPGEASERARALLLGLAHAVEHPGDMATATGHAVLGAFTAPLAITASAIESAKKGNIGPLEDELGALAQGTIELGKKLASGNPKEVEQTFRHELGAVPFIPLPHLAKRARNSDAVVNALGDLRGKVEAKRAVKRNRLIEDVKKAETEGAFVSRKHAKKIKLPVEDKRTGQPYINRPLGKLINHQRGRHEVSRIVSRIEQSGNNAAKAASQPIVKELRESKLATRDAQNIGDVQRIFNKYGLPLSKEGGEAYARMLHKNWPKNEHGAIPAGEVVDRHATKWLLDHPEAFEDPHLAKAVEIFDKHSEGVGTSPVNQYRAQVENIFNPLREAEGKHRIPAPEEMVPSQTTDLMATLVKGPLKEPWTRKTVLDFAKELRDGAGLKKSEKGPAIKVVDRGTPAGAGGAFFEHRPFTYDPSTHTVDLGALGTHHGELFAKDELRGREQGSIDPIEGHEMLKLGGPYSKLSPDEIANVLDALRKHTGQDIRTPEQWDKGITPEASSAGTKDAKALAEQIEATLVDGEGNKLMRPSEHGGPEHGVATTQSVKWTPEMAKAYVDQARGEVGARGLRHPSAYVADRLPDPLKGKKRPDFSTQLPTAKQWASQGKAAKSGNALADFENFIQSSIEAPHHKAAMVKGIDVLIQKATTKVDGKSAFTADAAKRAINQHKVPDGTVWVRPGVLKAALEKEHSITPEELRGVFEAEMDNGPRLANGEGPTPITDLPVTDQLKADLAEVQHLPGEKLVPMDGSYMNEFLAHMKPLGGLDTFLGNSTRFASRMILNSPAFEAIQFAQEGIPAAAALGRDVVHLPEALKALKQAAKDVEAGKITPEDVADWKAVASSSAGLYGTPTRRAMNAQGYLDPVRLAAKTSQWRKAFNVLNGNYLGEFDLNRAGVMRELGLSAKEIGDFKRASKGFNTWRKSANNLYKDMNKAVEDMKGMDVNERHAYIAHHPELEDRMHVAAHGMMGNWDSFTQFEKHVAPLTMFYTFQRYSALWFLFHFPLDHPIAATALSMLGAVNAKELQKLAKKHGEEPSILDYTMPVYSRGKGEEPGVGVYGKRAFPGLSTLGQAAISGKPSQLLGMAPPYLSIPAEAALGKSSYTGQELGENGWAYIGRSVAALNPALRLFLGLTGSESTAAKTFHEQDPLSQWRSFGDPYIGQSGSQYGKTKALEKNFNLKYGEGNIPSAFDNKMVQELLYGNNGKPKPEMLPEVLKAIHESEAASDAIKEAEAPFNGPASEFTPEQSELLREVENAWKTGPGGGSTASPATGGAAGNRFAEAVSGPSASGLSGNKFAEAASSSSNSALSGNRFAEALAK